MPDISDVLAQGDIVRVRVLHIDAGGKSRTLQGWNKEEGFPDLEEVESLVEANGEAGRYRLISMKKNSKPGRSATIAVIREGAATNGAAQKAEPVQMAAALVRMAAQFRELAERSVDSACLLYTSPSPRD